MKGTSRTPCIKRILQVAGIIASSVILLLYLLLPISMGALAAIRPPRECGPAPEGFQEVELDASDGMDIQKLAGWYSPGSNGAVILLLHGSKENRDAVRPYAQFLREAGFGVLAIDLRGHGMSGGQANAFGWECLQDIGTAVEFLEIQPDVKVIGGLGLSMGGETLLGAASEYPQITAIASDGASHRCTGDYIALPANNNLFRSWSTQVMYISTGVFTGTRQPNTIVESMSHAPNTSFLLIAAGNSQKEIDYNTLFANTAGEKARIWIVPGVGHTGAYSTYGEEYAETVTKFLESKLLDGQENR